MIEFNHEIQTSTTMIGSNVYTGTYETYLGNLLGCVKPSDRAKCEDDVAGIYLDLLTDVLNDELPFGSFETSYSGMYHPRYYNFETDAIEFTLRYSDEFKSHLAKYAEDNKGAFDTYLNDNFTTRDGFVSFTPNNYDELMDGFNDDDARCVSVLIGYYLDNESDADNSNYWFYENITELITENYIPYDYAVKYHNGYVGYCVEDYDYDKEQDRFRAYLFDYNGNLVNVVEAYDPWNKYRNSAFAAWDWTLERDVTNRHEHVGYEYDEMDIAEFHKLYGDKIDHEEF